MKIDQVHTVAVLGAGVMGHGIAHLCATSGFTTHLHDISDDFVQKGLGHIKANLQTAVDKGKASHEDMDAALARIQTFTDLKAAAANAQLVIEAAPEKIELKRQIFGDLGRYCARDAVLASNTSSLSLTQIAEAAPHPARVIGMHFFNPPYIMKLLEVVVARQTSPETLELVKQIGAKLTRDVIVVKDSPGFATSRLGIALGMEAIRMLEEGVASAEDIDKAMELGYRHPMGPLKLTDMVGLDTRLSITKYLHEKLGGQQFRPPKLLEQMVAEGKLGKKSGQGFYKW